MMFTYVYSLYISTISIIYTYILRSLWAKLVLLYGPHWAKWDSYSDRVVRLLCKYLCTSSIGPIYFHKLDNNTSLASKERKETITVRPDLAKFATSAKSLKSWAILREFVYYLAKFWNYFGKFCVPLGKFTFM